MTQATTPPVVPAEPWISPARWIAAPGLRANRESRVGPDELYSFAEDGGRWVTRKGHVEFAPTLGPEPLIGALRDERGLHFVGVSGRVYRADDPLGRLSLEREGEKTPPWQVATGRRAILTTGPTGLRRSVDGGKVFTQVVLPKSATPAGLAMGSDGRGLLLMLPERLAVTDDDGATWRDITNPFPATHDVLALRDVLVTRAVDGDAQLQNDKLVKATLDPNKSWSMSVSSQGPQIELGAPGGWGHHGEVLEYDGAFAESDWIESQVLGGSRVLLRAPLEKLDDVRVIAKLSNCEYGPIAAAGQHLVVACSGEPEDGCNGACTKFEIRQSDDGGASWTVIGRVGATSRPRLHVADDGTVVVWWLHPQGPLPANSAIRRPGAPALVAIHDATLIAVTSRGHEILAIGTASGEENDSLLRSAAGTSFSSETLPPKVEFNSISSITATADTIVLGTPSSKAIFARTKTGEWTRRDLVIDEHENLWVHGRHALILGKRPRESSDFGATWIDVDGPRLRYGPICGDPGCVFPHSYARIGWDLPARPPKILEPQATVIAPKAPIRCHVEGAWTDIHELPHGIESMRTEDGVAWVGTSDTGMFTIARNGANGLTFERRTALPEASVDVTWQFVRDGVLATREHPPQEKSKARRIDFAHWIAKTNKIVHQSVSVPSEHHRVWSTVGPEGSVSFTSADASWTWLDGRVETRAPISLPHSFFSTEEAHVVAVGSKRLVFGTAIRLGGFSGFTGWTQGSGDFAVTWSNTSIGTDDVVPGTGPEIGLRAQPIVISPVFEPRFPPARYVSGIPMTYGSSLSFVGMVPETIPTRVCGPGETTAAATISIDLQRNVTPEKKVSIEIDGGKTLDAYAAWVAIGPAGDACLVGYELRDAILPAYDPRMGTIFDGEPPKMRAARLWCERS